MKKNRKWKSVIGTFSLLIGISLQMVAYAGELLVPIGQTVGVTMDMKGVIVTDISDIVSYNGRFVSPARDAGMCVGDTVESINGKPVSSVEEFEKLVSALNEEELEITIIREQHKKKIRVKPIQVGENEKVQLGIRVKDVLSGIGTITYLNPETGEFGGLGHGIVDKTDGKTAEIFGGKIFDTRIVSVQKGGKGQPGELVGIFTEEDKVLGEITDNTNVGIKGSSSEKNLRHICEALPIASREEVEIGKAEIISNIEEGKIKKFQVEIKKINRDIDNPKGMVLKVTDSELLEKTGGIVQGMSGSPILQNGKIVGAVTHVFVNDPTRGYGIFIENMLANAKETE